MKPKAYVETTIVSYLTAWPSRDVIVAAHQQITDEWWRTKRQLVGWGEERIPTFHVGDCVGGSFVTLTYALPDTN